MLKIFKQTLLVAAAFSASTFAFGQSHNHIEKPVNKHWCGTHEAIEEVAKTDPTVWDRIAQSQKELKEWEKENGQNKNTSNTYIIPVVVHIIHNFGGENISKAQVDDAIRIMNEDFSLTNSDRSRVIAAFQPIIGNPQVEFRLAKRDPNGNCTDGVTRTISTLTFDAGENVKGLVGWDTRRYYNIWVVANISSGAGAYAFYPGSAPTQQNEGVVCRASQFGSIGASSGGNFAARTMTHETGHWLNLPHTWGNSNTPGAAGNCNIDDGVDDTPNTTGVAQQNCPLNQRSCNPNVIDNVENYMDYSTCARMFTQGQVNRMVAALNSSRGFRNNLWTPTNLAQTGVLDPATPVCAPRVQFQTLARDICQGSSQGFAAEAFNVADPSVVNFTWYLPGSSQPVATGSNVTVTYNTPGVYSVKVVARTSAGGDSITVPNMITVRNAEQRLPIPFGESFESNNFPNVNPDPTYNWYVDSSAGARNSFRLFTDAAATGNNSMRVANRTNPVGSSAYLYSPIINGAGYLATYRLWFKMAYALFNANSNDILRVSVTTNCGQTWTQLREYTRTGSIPINTVTGNRTLTWVPEGADWRQETVAISTLRFAQRYQLRFESEANLGNNLFLDDIIIGPSGVFNSLENSVNTGAWSAMLFPNPANSNARITLYSEQAAQTEIVITDLTGRKVSKAFGRYLEEGTHNIQLSEIVGGQLASGAYLIKVNVNGMERTISFIQAP